jgi:hypothetical protein
LHTGKGLDDGVQRKDQQEFPRGGRPERPVVDMLYVIIAGIGLLLVIAVIVGMMDVRQASGWRRVAADRRRSWEARQPEFHGVDGHDAESWDDD